MDRHSNQKESQLEGTKRSLPQWLNGCPDHKFSLLTDISLQDCGSGLVFKCNKCKKSNENVEISEIAFSYDHHVFDNYPILPEVLRQKIREILESTESKENMVDFITQYFKNLKSQILQQISDMEEEMIIKAQEIDQFQKSLNNEYIKLTRKIELRDIIFNDSNIQNKSESVKVIVLDVMENSNQIEQKLQGMIDIFNQTNGKIESQNLNSNFLQKIETCIKSIKTKEMQAMIEQFNI